LYIVDRQIQDLEAIERDDFQEGLVSAVVPVYERKMETLVSCLEAISSQCYSPVEVLVVNNGARNIEEVLSRCVADVRVLNLKENLGASYARNLGALESRGEFIWFVDSDIIDINTNCAGDMVAILEQHTDIGAVGGITYENSAGETSVHVGQTIDHHYLEHPELFTLYDDLYVNTGCVMIRRRVLGRIGGFTEYIEYLHEDNDLGFKIKACGLRCVGDSRAFGHHAPRLEEPLEMATQKMAYKNTLLYFLVNYQPVEFLSFLLLKLKHRKGSALSSPAGSPPQPFPVRVRQYSTKLFALFLVAMFLISKAARVTEHRRDRQRLLRSLTENQP